MRKKKNMVGQVFGMIKVVSFAGKNNFGQNYWNCICTHCGRKVKKRTANLQRGCIFCAKDKGKYSTSRLHHIWKAMIMRCTDENYHAFNLYGGRGVKIFDEWIDFTIFRMWALKNGYQNNLELDRIDTNGNYMPSNCRWATERKQQNNRRNNIIFFVDGKTYTITELSRIYNINIGTLRSRIKRGWNIEKALSKEIGRCNIKPAQYTINGKSHTFYEWSEIFCIDRKTVKKYMKQGMSLAEALGVNNV